MPYPQFDTNYHQLARWTSRLKSIARKSLHFQAAQTTLNAARSSNRLNVAQFVSVLPLKATLHTNAQLLV
jgi:hypothetical protein